MEPDPLAETGTKQQIQSNIGLLIQEAIDLLALLDSASCTPEHAHSKIARIRKLQDEIREAYELYKTKETK